MVTLSNTAKRMRARYCRAQPARGKARTPERRQKIKCAMTETSGIAEEVWS